MTDNPWTAEVHMEAGSNGTDHAVWLYERQTYIAKPVHGSLEKCERFAARINGTNQPTGDVRADLLDGTNLIRHWLVGRTVDAVGLAAELRQWADTFDPWKDQPTVAAKVNGADAVISGDFAAYLNLTSATDLPGGVSPWLGDEADAAALGSIVQTLPDDEWERSIDGVYWRSTPNADAVRSDLYLLRRKPQTVTVELPKDVAEAMCDEVNIDYHTVAAACRKALGR